MALSVAPILHSDQGNVLQSKIKHLKCMCMCLCMGVCVYMCVCMRKRGRGRDRERERENKCISVYDDGTPGGDVCMYVFLCVCM